jgi:hypothetical protein
MAPRTRAATRAERVHLTDLPAEILEDLARQLSTADHASLALTCRPLAAAVANVAKPVAQMLNELGLGGVPIHESLQHNTTIVRALTMAAKPKPKVQDGNDDAAGAAALSLIIGCALQESRAQLVIGLLDRGVHTWPLVGCEFDHSSLRPPLLAALEAYETFADKAEWHKMFHALADRGDLDTCYGPELLTAEIVYYGKFKKNYAPEWSDEGESESSDEVE